MPKVAKQMPLPTRSLAFPTRARRLKAPAAQKTLAWMAFAAILAAGLDGASASPTQPPEADEQTTFFHSLSPEEPFDRVPEGRELEFDEGVLPDTQALRLSEIENPQSGVAFLVDTTLLDEGTIEIWMNPSEDVAPTAQPRAILNLGSAGNTKFRLEFKESKVRARFGAILLTSSPVDIGSWSHVALSWSHEKGLKLYVNGHLVAEKEGSATLWATSAKELLTVGDAPDYSDAEGRGWFSANNNFIGSLAYLRVSNIAKSSFPDVHPPGQ